jgi:hypothetical protein
LEVLILHSEDEFNRVSARATRNFVSTNPGSLTAPGNQHTLNHYGPSHRLDGDAFDHTWFDKCSASITTDCFSRPAALEFGDAGPNVMMARRLGTSLFRNSESTSAGTWQIRAEGLIVVSHCNGASGIRITSRPFRIHHRLR